IDSRGSLTGNASAQLRSLGGPFARARPDFQYHAELDRKFPQRIFGGFSWKFHPRWRLALQADWVDWSNAFEVLPVKLTRGTNADINRLVGSNGLQEYTPLRWRDQVVYRAGMEFALTEACFLRGGYAYGRSPAPEETLTPLGAAIPEQTLTAGAGYRWRCYELDFAYQLDLPKTRQVGRSSLRDGEYSESTLRVAGHWLGLTISVHY
ncbi:MAG: outer membrane protein transport protein, partial [Verrucomicrobia bacterium]|nr:outer membrane protein transport protein [Verrucomicrobiota bacterium]